MANKKAYILVLCLCILPGSTKVWGMALFDFLRISLFSQVNGQVLLEGKPIAGAEVTRTAIYKQDNHVETTVSDQNGSFHFDALDVHSVNRILPSEIVVTQKITIHYDGKDYLAWKTVKRSAEENDELSGYLGKLVCDLSASEKQTETAHSVIAGIC